MSEELKASLQQLVDCPICFEVYVQPKALPCLHTLCNSCLQQVSSWAGIKCPFCNKRYHSRDVVSDFRTQQLVDLYNTLDLEVAFNNLHIVDNAAPQTARTIGDEGDGGSVDMTLMATYTPPSPARVTSMAQHARGYWFVLSNGRVVRHASQQVITAREPRTAKPGIVGGVLAGLLVSPLGAAAAITAGLATAGAVMLSANAMRNRSLEVVKHKIIQLASLTNNTLVALCSSDSLEGTKMRILSLSESGVIQKCLYENRHNLDIHELFVLNDTLYTGTVDASVQKYLDNDKGEWYRYQLPKLSHVAKEGVQMTVDECHGYTSDHKTVYKFTRNADIVSAHNIPDVSPGGMSLRCASGGCVVLQHMRHHSLHVLDTSTHEWFVLRIPEPEWKPAHVIINNQGQDVHALYTKPGASKVVVFTCKITKNRSAASCFD